MLKSIVATGAVLSVLAPFASAGTLPLLTGSYVYTSTRFCQIHLDAQYISGSTPGNKSAPVVTQIGIGSGANANKVDAGTLSFVQGGSAGSGTAMINGFSISGSSVLLTTSGPGGGGVEGAPLGTDTSTGTGTFIQTATMVSIKTPDGTNNYHIYYGKVAAGIVQYAALIGVDRKGCAEQIALTHN
jgi:hypothetical protein